MTQSKVLSDFEKGVINAYHRSNRSLRHISNEQNYPKPTVGYVIQLSKVRSDSIKISRVARSPKLGNREEGSAQRIQETPHSTYGAHMPRSSTGSQVCYNKKQYQ